MNELKKVKKLNQIKTINPATGKEIKTFSTIDKN